MSIIVEDGTGVELANSYVSIANARAFATLRGVTLAADDAVVTAQLLLGMDYLEAKRSEYQGHKTTPTQELQWPRTGVEIDCVAFPTNALPRELTKALCQLVVEQTQGVDLAPTRTEAFITEDTIGPITTKYSDKILGGAGHAPTMPNVEASLSPLLSRCGQVGYLEVVRA